LPIFLLVTKSFCFFTVKPNNTGVTFTKNPAVVGGNFAVICESNGLPEPSYTITHNGTMLSTGKMYTILKVKWSDAGTYKCIAENKLGRDSAFAYIIFDGKIRFLDTFFRHLCSVFE
jgi:hypothetical protein